MNTRRFDWAAGDFSQKSFDIARLPVAPLRHTNGRWFVRQPTTPILVCAERTICCMDKPTSTSSATKFKLELV